jgi:hypothetical protein
MIPGFTRTNEDIDPAFVDHAPMRLLLRHDSAVESSLGVKPQLLFLAIQDLHWKHFISQVSLNIKRPVAYNM